MSPLTSDIDYLWFFCADQTQMFSTFIYIFTYLVFCFTDFFSIAFLIFIWFWCTWRECKLCCCRAACSVNINYIKLVIEFCKPSVSLIFMPTCSSYHWEKGMKITNCNDRFFHHLVPSFPSSCCWSSVTGLINVYNCCVLLILIPDPIFYNWPCYHYWCFICPMFGQGKSH